VDKDNKLMSSEGYEATEEELQEAAANDDEAVDGMENEA
jgi:hypothetical protein